MGKKERGVNRPLWGKKKKDMDGSPTYDFLDHWVGEEQHCL